MLPKIWYGGKFFFVGYAYDGYGPQNQLWTCSRGFHVWQQCCPKYCTGLNFFLCTTLMMGLDLKISFGHALEDFLSGSDAAKNIVGAKFFFVGYSYDGHGPQN